jgi:hypothetical protein
MKEGKKEREKKSLLQQSKWTFQVRIFLASIAASANEHATDTFEILGEYKEYLTRILKEKIDSFDMRLDDGVHPVTRFTRPLSWLFLSVV